MEAAAHRHPAHDEHHAMPTEGRALTVVALSATLHCLTGCAIGEITGMVVGTALGFSDLETIALAVALAFLFGYTLTSLPLLRAGLALAAVIPIALASDTLSIAVMEIVDNAIMLAVPGAMEAGPTNVLFWGSLSVALVIAGAVALPVNRWLIARGKGHAAVHETGIHGGPDPRVIGVISVVAAVFGTTVLMAEVIGDDEAGHGGGHAEPVQASAAEGPDEPGHAGHGEEAMAPAAGDADPVRGTTVAEGDVALELDQTELAQGEDEQLSFRILDDGDAVTDFDIEHERRMHLIVVRRDLTGFQHLHPTMDEDGTWRTGIRLRDAGSYRVFADFARGGSPETLGADLWVDGRAEYRQLPRQRTTAVTESGYEVAVEGSRGVAEQESKLAFEVSRAGVPIHVEPYLGAGGHLVALREGDLAFLHVHPTTGAGHEAGAEHEGDSRIRFLTEFPSDGSYRLFLQFKDQGQVHTAAFTREVTR